MIVQLSVYFLEFCYAYPCRLVLLLTLLCYPTLLIFRVCARLHQILCGIWIWTIPRGLVVRVVGSEQAPAPCRRAGILRRRGLPQSPENRQDVATSITDVIPIRFLRCKQWIDTNAYGLGAGIFFNTRNLSGSFHYCHLCDMEFFGTNFCLSCTITLPGPKFLKIFIHNLI